MGKENWEIIIYNEDKPEKFGVEITANILFKRFKKDSSMCK